MLKDHCREWESIQSDFVDLKKVESLEIKTIITKVKNTMDRFNCRVNTTEKKIGKSEKESEEVTTMQHRQTKRKRGRDGGR